MMRSSAVGAQEHNKSASLLQSPRGGGKARWRDSGGWREWGILRGRRVSFPGVGRHVAVAHQRTSHSDQRHDTRQAVAQRHAQPTCLNHPVYIDCDITARLPIVQPAMHVTPFPPFPPFSPPLPPPHQFSALDASLDVDSLPPPNISGTIADTPCNHMH